MTMRKFVLTIAFGLACVVSSASAHHSFSMFDQTKTVEKHGATVREFRWVNPHAYMVVDVKDGKEVTSYTLQCGSVSMMMRAGWKFNTIKPGDKVDVAFFALRDGKSGGMLKAMTLPDGRTLKGL